jgi:hypothetical protein
MEVQVYMEEYTLMAFNAKKQALFSSNTFIKMAETGLQPNFDSV